MPKIFDNILRKQLAQDFEVQSTIGGPTDDDEVDLKRLSAQLKEQRVIVILFLRYSLHAKLYLLFREEKISPVIGCIGSSNLTLAGLQK